MRGLDKLVSALRGARDRPLLSLKTGLQRQVKMARIATFSEPHHGEHNTPFSASPQALVSGAVGSVDHAAAREAMIEEVMRRERGARGQIIMPASEADPKVNPHVLELLAYLWARADGKLGPGEPKLSVATRR